MVQKKEKTVFTPPMPPSPPISYQQTEHEFMLMERPVSMLLFASILGVVTLFAPAQIDVETHPVFRASLLLPFLASLYCLVRGLTLTVLRCDKSRNSLCLSQRIVPSCCGRQAKCLLTDVQAIVYEYSPPYYGLYAQIKGELRPIASFCSITLPPPPIAEDLAQFIGVPVRKKSSA